MMKVKTLLGVAFLWSLITFSCTFNNLEDLNPLDNPCDTVTVEFSQEIATVMTMNCTDTNFGPGCHEAGSPNGDFTAYDGIKAKFDAGALRNRAIDLKNMPPSYSKGPTALNDCDLSYLRQWVDAGAPQN